MGTWGHNYFESDAAFDCMAYIEESDDPKASIEGLLDTTASGEYLDADEAEGAIVAAAYIDRQLNGTRYSNDDRDELLEIDTFPEKYPNVDLSSLRLKAVQALIRVLAEDSELYELWEETEEHLPAWKQTIENLIARLEK